MADSGVFMFLFFSFQDYTCPVCESGFIEELSEDRRYVGIFLVLARFCVFRDLSVLNVSVQVGKWVCVHIFHPPPEPLRV